MEYDWYFIHTKDDISLRVNCTLYAFMQLCVLMQTDACHLIKHVHNVGV